MKITNTNTKIGMWIARQRVKKGWSQCEMGRQTGIDRTMINKYEAGARSSYNIKTLSKLANIFDCELVVKFKKKA